MGLENPDWLPDDWKIVVKIRNYGRRDKYYINTSNGKRFQSKPEVLRYLKNSPQQSKQKNLDKINIERTAAETLPPGWIKETRVKRKRGKTRSDKFYIDPDTGRSFNSLTRVFRYLETKGLEVPEPEPKPVSKPESMPDDKDHITAEAENHSQYIDIRRTAAETLPTGWIKEIRTKKKGAKTRCDKFYLDPDTGRYFNSLTQVFRYLEAKNSGEPESKPDDKYELVAELEDHSQSISAEAKGQKLVDKKADKRYTRLQSNTSELELVGDSKVDKQNKLKEIDKEDNSLAKLPDKPPTESRAKRMRNYEVTEIKVNEGVQGDQISNSGTEVDTLRKVDTAELHYMERREKKDDSLVLELPNELPKVNGNKRGRGISKNKRLASNKIENEVIGDQSFQPVGSDQREEDNVMHLNKRKKTNSKISSDFPHRSSKRVARLDVQAMISGMPDINVPVEFCNYNNPNEHPTTKSLTGNKQKEHMTSSNGDISCIEDNNNNNNALEKIKEDKNELESSLDDLLKDPCFEFAIKTLTGAIPIEDVNKVRENLSPNPPVSSSMGSSYNQTCASPRVLPCDDIWADPCFEFAVKTLTGEMPNVANVSNVKLSFHESFGASAKLDNSYQPNYLFSQFEAEKKKLSAIQQGVRDLPLPYVAVNSKSKEFTGHLELDNKQPSPWH